MTLKDLFQKATSTPAPVTDTQWNTYIKLCRQKFVQPADRAAFNSATLSKEIERLFTLPFARKAYPQQIARFKEMCETLGIKTPADDVMDKWSNVEITARMNVLGKRLPMTEGQIKMLKNFYRFGIISEADMASIEPNQTSASEVIAAHNDKYQAVSDGKLTLNQAERIIQLEQDLHHNTIDIRDLSNMTFDEASERVAALKKEEDDRREARMYGWDNSGALYDMSEDGSRSRDVEENEALSFGEKDFKQKLSIVRKLQSIVNIGHDDNDTLDESNIDKTIIDLYELASAIGETQAAYSVMSAAVDEGEPTQKAGKGRRRSNK